MTDHQEYKHTSVMPKEVLEFLEVKPGKIYIDGTLGGAGHSKLILEALGDSGHLYSFDQDIMAIKEQKNEAKKYSNWTLVHENFANINEYCKKNKIKITGGLLLDLGLSSIQLDDPKRGLSFHSEEPLDMRLNPDEDLTAADIINFYKEKEIADLIYKYGEEKRSREIAREIVAKRPFHSCKELGDLIKTIYARKSHGKTFKTHPATKTFQALRIAVNQELDVLEKVLNLNPELYEVGARVVVISFHSLEDRIVKNFFRAYKQKNLLKILSKKPITASIEELDSNLRSRSAKLRAAVIGV